MVKILINLDEETFNLLPRKGNRSQIIREAIKVYNSDISPDNLVQIRASYKALVKKVNEFEEALAYNTEILEYIKKKLPDQ